MLRNVSTAKRIFALILIMVLFIGGVVWGFLNNSKQVESFALDNLGEVMLADAKDKVKTTTDAVAVALGEQLAEIEGKQAREDHIRKAVDKFIYEEDKSGYIFVYEGTVNVAFPVKQSNVGKDLGGAKDVNGVFVIKELDRIAKGGGGFLEYVWPKPDKGDQPKVSYARLIPGTQYWIGTGVYVDNIQERQNQVGGAIHDMVAESITYILGVVGGLFLLVVLPASIAIVRSIVGPIRAATDAAGKISEGDLSVSLDAKGTDEAAQLETALNSMVATLKQNIEEITEKTRDAEHKASEAQVATRKAEAATRKAERAKAEGMYDAAMRLEAIVERVSTASEEISIQSEEIRQGTEVQSQRIGETATAMEEMNATVLEVARNSSQAAGVGQEAKERAVSGSQVVDNSITAMQTTQRQAEELRDNMALLGQQADAIGSVMNVINDIADQTNLLALNAAIEAARAGEAGRGFAVVADEVRKLAEKTMDATKEVGDSINAIQQAASNNIKSTEVAVEDLGKAVDLANESGEVLREIVEKVEDSAQQIQSIATAAEEQSATSEEINRTVEEINQITAETSRGVNESTVALRELAEQMADLTSLIDELKSEGGGVAAEEEVEAE